MVLVFVPMCLHMYVCVCVYNLCGREEMLHQAYENAVALFTGGFKPRSRISCLSMCWRRAARKLSPGKEATLQNGPLGSICLRRNSK